MSDMYEATKEGARFLKALEEYFANLGTNNLSKRTLDEYGTVFRNFYLWWDSSEYREDEPSFPVMLAYKKELIDTGISSARVRYILSRLRAFFEAMSDLGLGEKRAYTEIPIPKSMLPKTTKQPYEKQSLLSGFEVLKLLRTTQMKSVRMGKNTLMKNALIAVFITTGIRTSELISLSPSDIAWEKELLIVRHGKGDKYRVVALPKLAQNAILAYLESGYRGPEVGDDEPLFGNYSAGFGTLSGSEWHAYSRRTVHQIVRKYAKRVLGRDDIGGHDLRHAYAQTLLNSDVSMEEIKEVLGHASIKTTEVYTGRLDPERVNKKIAKVFEGEDFFRWGTQQKGAAV